MGKRKAFGQPGNGIANGLKASANGIYHEPEALHIEEAQSQADRASVPGREADSPG